MINFIRIKPRNIHNPKGGKAQPPKVSINGNTFTLNQKALDKLHEISGLSKFSFVIHVSECGDYVGFEAVSSLIPMHSMPKSISSGDAKDRLNVPSRAFKFNVDLDKVQGGILYGKIKISVNWY